jgi:hypothetical protein
MTMGLRESLHAQQPPLDAHHHECGRRSPHTYVEVDEGKCPHVVARPYDPQCCSLQRPLQRDDEHPYGKSQQGGPLQDGRLHARVAAAVGLGCEPRGAHAQEAEVPIQQVEHHGAHRHGPDIERAAAGVEVAGNGGVEQSQQRYGDVGHNGGQGDAPYFAIQALGHV